jgi:hypothetical protein
MAVKYLPFFLRCACQPHSKLCCNRGNILLKSFLTYFSHSVCNVVRYQTAGQPRIPGKANLDKPAFKWLDSVTDGVPLP